MSEIAANIAKVRARLQQAQALSNRNENDVRLLAVSKQQPVWAIREAFKSGLLNFGENYLQEALVKIKELHKLPLIWHFIGPLQSNKTKEVAEQFAWLHSLDRLKIAQRLSSQRPSTLSPLNVCLQVNIDQETSKSGIQANEISAIAAEIAVLPHLKLRGLMAIPNPNQGADGLESAFTQMANLFTQLQKQLPEQQIDTLSMGMSADLELAVASGSTLVRIGTDIFGKRK